MIVDVICLYPMITSIENRREMLESHGVPVAFLDAIETPPAEDLEYILKFPDAAYFYLKTVETTYSILRGYDITPIFDGGNGDTYWVLLTNSTDTRFVHFELEQDEIYNDYGNDFLSLLADVVIKFYEFADELDDSEIINVAQALGFPNAEPLVSALTLADEQGSRCTFESDAEWRRTNIPSIINHGR